MAAAAIDPAALAEQRREWAATIERWQEREAAVTNPVAMDFALSQLACEAKHCRTRLFQTSDYKDKFEDLDRALSALRGRLATVQKDLDIAEAQVSNLVSRDNYAKGRTDFEKARDHEMLEHWRERLRKYTSQRDKLAVQCSKLKSRVDAAYQKCLQP